MRPLQQLIQGIRRALVHNAWRQAGSCEPLDESVQICVPLEQPPVEPGRLVVNAIGVVVAALAAAHLVAHEQHWRSHSHQLHRQEVLDLSAAPRLDFRILRGPLDTAVPARVVGGTVTVVLAVRLVVLLVVRDQVI